MAYNRLNGTPFTVKNKMEQKEIVDLINEQPGIKDFMKCVGLDVEQFTGRIIHALMRMGNKMVKFDVSGVFPTLKLSQYESSNVFNVEFPNKKQKEVEIPKMEKKKIVLPAAIIEKLKEKEKKIEEVKKEEEVKVEEPAAENEKVEEPKVEEIQNPAVEEKKEEEIIPVEEEKKPIPVVQVEKKEKKSRRNNRNSD